VKPVDQVLALNRVLYPGRNAELLFASRLGYSGSGETARVQITDDGGLSWQDIWSRAGTGNAGQTTFGPIAISLRAFAGHTIQVRFVYGFGQGTYYSDGKGVGWYLDDISFADTRELSRPATTETAATGFDFTPVAAGEYQLQVRPMISERWFAYGPTKAVTASAVPANITILSIQPTDHAGMQITFRVPSGRSSDYQLETLTSVGSAWTLVDDAALVPILSGNQYSFIVRMDSARQRFYRVRAGP
jgi:hypothetical protein